MPPSPSSAVGPVGAAAGPVGGGGSALPAVVVSGGTRSRPRGGPVHVAEGDVILVLIWIQWIDNDRADGSGLQHRGTPAAAHHHGLLAQEGGRRDLVVHEPGLLGLGGLHSPQDVDGVVVDAMPRASQHDVRELGLHLVVHAGLDEEAAIHAVGLAAHEAEVGRVLVGVVVPAAVQLPLVA